MAAKEWEAFQMAKQARAGRCGVGWGAICIYYEGASRLKRGAGDSLPLYGSGVVRSGELQSGEIIERVK